VSVRALRDQVLSLVGSPPALLCVTGASGAGKTTMLESLRTQVEPRHLPTLAFDSLGVPSPEQMTAGWESPRGWQKAMTWHWVQTAKNVYRTHPLVVLEGSFDPQYAIAACTANRMRFAIVLLHADDSVRHERLTRRGQPELHTDDMCSWASYLRESTTQLGGHVLDANAQVDAVVEAVCAYALTLLSDAPADPPKPRRN
jgi:GTPase SAR1 family protein